MCKASSPKAPVRCSSLDIPADTDSPLLPSFSAPARINQAVQGLLRLSLGVMTEAAPESVFKGQEESLVCKVKPDLGRSTGDPQKLGTK